MTIRLIIPLLFRICQFVRDYDDLNLFLFFSIAEVRENYSVGWEINLKRVREDWVSL